MGDGPHRLGPKWPEAVQCLLGVKSCLGPLKPRCLLCTRKRTRHCGHAVSAKGQLETSCHVPDHGLHGRKCTAVAAHSAAKIKNTKPGPLAITATKTSPMP